MRVNRLDGMNKIWSYQAKRYDMQGSDMEAGYQVGGCHADVVGGAVWFIVKIDHDTFLMSWQKCDVMRH